MFKHQTTCLDPTCFFRLKKNKRWKCQLKINSCLFGDGKREIRCAGVTRMGLVVTCSILPFNQIHLHLNAAVACSDSVCCKCVKERLCVCVSECAQGYR